MDCEKALERIEAMIDGRLSPREDDEIREHIRSCPSCAAEEESLRRVGALLRGWVAARVERRGASLEALWTRVEAGIGERRGRSGVSELVRRWFWVPAAAALAVLLFLVYSSDGTRLPFRPRSFDVAVEDLESDAATVALVDKGEDLPRVIWIIENGKT